VYLAELGGEPLEGGSRGAAGLVGTHFFFTECNHLARIGLHQNILRFCMPSGEQK